MTAPELTPREIVAELDKHIIGQGAAKRAVAIGSGGPFAQAAARALIENTELDARSIVERSLNIAADICIYTNRNLVIEELKA